MSVSKAALPQNDNVAHALAGAGGGILSMILTYPLITLSTRAQVETRRASTSTSPSSSPSRTPSLPSAIRAIIRREGLSGLYSGLFSALFGIGLVNFIYYYWYEWTRAFFEAAALRNGGKARKLTTLETIVAGAIAGSATAVLSNPIWVVNTRMTTRRHQLEDGGERGVEEGGVGKAKDGSYGASKSPPTTLSTLLSLLRNEGPMALFSGVLPALVLVMNPILQYTLFEKLKNAVEKRRPMTPTLVFFLGALGKLFATTLTYPYITVKSRAHVAGGNIGDRGAKVEGMSAAMRRIVVEEGYAGLYKGIGTKVTQSVLTAAFLFAFKDALYEQTVRLRYRAALKAIT